MWLLVTSYYFYMSWNPRYVILMAVSTIITWSSGLLLEKIHNGDECTFELGGSIAKKKKLVVAGSFIINLGILFFFKYFDFTIENINLLLSRLGIRTIHTGLDIILPVGISFYTFQALSYTMDVYKGDIKAEKNLLRYALFVSFFPQLVAGPIERSRNLLSQVNNTENMKLWDYERVTRGCMVMLWGFFMKMVIADRVAIFVDGVYNQYWRYGSVELVLASILFAIQIYCDFGGYSLIAIGASEVMGFELMENFNTPYFATSIRDFWSRWHISLSSWFRDYLYIPLGGSRKGKMRKYLNKMIIFLVSGLWHGASWTYVVWGGIHGIYQVAGEVLQPVRNWINGMLKTRTDNFSYRFGQGIVTFILVDFAWIFFRAKSIGDAFEIIKRMLTKMNTWVLFDGSLYNCGLEQKEFHLMVTALVVLLLVDLVKKLKNERIDTFLAAQNLWFRWTVLITLFMSCLMCGVYGSGYDASQFIYFQF